FLIWMRGIPGLKKIFDRNPLGLLKNGVLLSKNPHFSRSGFEISPILHSRRVRNMPVIACASRPVGLSPKPITTNKERSNYVKTNASQSVGRLFQAVGRRCRQKRHRYSDQRDR